MIATSTLNFEQVLAAVPKLSPAERLRLASAAIASLEKEGLAASPSDDAHDASHNESPPMSNPPEVTPEEGPGMSDERHRFLKDMLAAQRQIDHELWK